LLTHLEAGGWRLEASEEDSSRFKVQGSKSEVPKSQILNPKSYSEAEACFLKAIEIARTQHAKSLELRAVMSLVRLRQQRITNHVPRHTQHEALSKFAEAHSMLAEVYNWFTEGFETKDLQEAKALLGKLSDRAIGPLMH
jgi:hypothetical protein